VTPWSFVAGRTVIAVGQPLKSMWAAPYGIEELKVAQWLEWPLRPHNFVFYMWAGPTGCSPSASRCPGWATRRP
jgi:hypothetical protein